MVVLPHCPLPIAHSLNSGRQMSIFFILQLIGFFVSIILLNHWVNLVLTRRPFFDFFEFKYLPCFAWGWFVYFSIYMIGRWSSAPVESVHMIYTAMALLIPTLAGVWYLFLPQASVWQRQRRDLPLDPWTMLVVGAFIGGMIYVGPYLEFPSDPLEHLYRIQAWEKAQSMNYIGYDETFLSRFIYFFEHWLLQHSGLSLGDRTGLALLSPVLQGLLFWEFIRLTKLLTNITALSWFGGILSWGYLGYHSISFYRYTVLSGSFLAYLVCLEGLTLIIAVFLNEQWRYLFLLPPLLIFCWKNHEQATLLQLNAIAGICTTLLIFRYRAIAPNFRRLMLVLTIGVIVSSILIVLSRDVISTNSLPISRANIFNLFGWKIQYPKFSQFNEMIGIVGWLAMISALLVLFCNRPSRNLDIMAALCAWPMFVVLNPLSIEVLHRVIPIDVFHRLIYGSLYWVFLIVFIQCSYNRIFNTNLVCDRVGISSQTKKNKNFSKLFLYLSISFFALLSWIPGYPMYGKMRHLWLKVDPRLDGANLRPTIEYLRSHTPQACSDRFAERNYLPIRSYILSDSYVNTYLLGTGYFYTVTNRSELSGYESEPLGITVSANENMDYATFVEIAKMNICYVVLYIQTQELYSWTGAVVGHWGINHAQTQRYYSPKVIEWITKNPQDFELVFTDDSVRVFKVL